MKRALRRHNNFKKALRKKEIYENHFQGFYPFVEYKGLNQYSKNKIHCSCPLCRAKVNNKGKHRNHHPSKNWKISDLKKINRLDDNLKMEGWPSKV